jgi:hypothetical protein
LAIKPKGRGCQAVYDGFWVAFDELAVRFSGRVVGLVYDDEIGGRTFGCEGLDRRDCHAWPDLDTDIPQFICSLFDELSPMRDEQHAFVERNSRSYDLRGYNCLTRASWSYHKQTLGLGLANPG